uniref:Uncharacterized protein n=1 Tax=Desulfobacca acetoxidans TaxID=60893 RepID=A0A7V4G914_9BACT
MKRVVMLLGFLYLAASCVGYEDFQITIQLHRDGAFTFNYAGIVVGEKVDGNQEEEKRKSDHRIKEFKYLGRNRFRLVFEEQGNLEQPFYFISDHGKERLVAMQRVLNTVILTVKPQTTQDYDLEKIKIFYKVHEINYGGTVTVTTEARVLQHNAHRAPSFTLWGPRTYTWRLTSLDEPAAAMVATVE